MQLGLKGPTLRFRRFPRATKEVSESELRAGICDPNNIRDSHVYRMMNLVRGVTHVSHKAVLILIDYQDQEK